jgi:drug/metabolite transporter (DMT)-like permease
MIGSSPRESSRDGIGRKVLATAVLSGIGLGLTGVAFAQTPETAGIWPAFAAKTSSAVILGAALLLSRGSAGAASGRGLGLSLAAGAVDVIATVLFLIALQRGLLVLVSVIASLYPASTVLLARMALRETIGRVQAAGLGIAAAAVALIAAS